MKYSLLIAALISVPTLLSGSALFGQLSLNGAKGQNVAVGPCTNPAQGDCIDFDWTGTASGTPPVVVTSNPPGIDGGPGGTGTFTITNPAGFDGDGTGNNVIVGDLSSTGDPAGGTPLTPYPNFITFPGETWSVALSEVEAGSFPSSSVCIGSTIASGQVCSPAGTPFNEVNTSCDNTGACQVDISFDFMGVADDGSGDLSNVTGTFSTTFSGTNFETINNDIGKGDVVETSDSGTMTFTAQSTVPEPMTSVLLGSGLIFLGLVGRRARRKS